VHQKQITEHGLVRCWRKLLRDKDIFSLSFQNFIKDSPAYLKHLKAIENTSTSNLK
jgi:hypothetical protein